MKKISFVLFISSFAGFVVFISCKKEHSCENCTEKNQSPIANAGKDTIIILPIDSTMLDGTASTDPDNNISDYEWKKITGPSSSNIYKHTAIKTEVNRLTEGTYQFELKVTDKGGLFSKDTVQVIVNNPATPNEPPIANAGADQTISLPTNTVNLDGGGSTDPDNNIISYAWTKTSGPSSFGIVNGNTVQTQVTNLVEGIYQLELKVTDAGGLFSKDTVQIAVNTSNSSSFYISGCNANLTPFGHLSRQSWVGGTAAAGTKIFFGSFDGTTALTDIYDISTRTWSTSNQRFGNINIGTKLIDPYYNYPVNLELFEIYDASSDSRTTYQVPEARAYIKHALVGNKVVFAGGSNPDSPYTSISKRIDIYDAVSNSWSSLNFNEARAGMTVAGIGNKIFFAGGYKVRHDSLVQVCDDDGNNCVMVPAIVKVNRIDIYDLSANTWSTTELSYAGADMGTSVVGNKLVFIGINGNLQNNFANIYDASDNSWSSYNLGPTTGYWINGVYTVGNKVLVSYAGVDKLHIYDALNNSWSTAQVPHPLISSGQQHHLIAATENKILFFTVYDNESHSRNVDIYDAFTNTWCHTELNRSLVRSGLAVSGNRIYIAGGIIKSNSNNDIYDQMIDDVWIFNF